MLLFSCSSKAIETFMLTSYEIVYQRSRRSAIQKVQARIIITTLNVNIGVLMQFQRGSHTLSGTSRVTTELSVLTE